MRFDDSLATVLAADATTDFGAQSAWRQLVDLTGRGRVADQAVALERLRELRARVPVATRAASGRALALTEAPASLVEFFAQDDPRVASPVLRTARLSSAEWLALLPQLSPGGRAVLRHRRDLPADVVRGLESFGSTDFVLADVARPVPRAAATPRPVAVTTEQASFASFGAVARSLPIVAEAFKQVAEPQESFAIADLVARIDAYQQQRPVTDAAADERSEADHFRFATDTAGVIRWVDGVARGPLVGVSLATTAMQGVAQVDTAAGAALRNRAAFRGARLAIGGAASAAGEWRLTGAPSFEAASGRFLGMSGIARRVPPVPTSAADQLRQLLHELRTPANAIAGFAELIGSELLGAVPPIYRDRAGYIERQAADLLAALEDLDTVARVESGALELRPTAVDLCALVRGAIAALAPAAAAAGAVMTIEAPDAVMIRTDDRAALRLVTRLLVALLAAARPGERLRVQVVGRVRNGRVSLTRPSALADLRGEAELAIDQEPARGGDPLLGTGFTLRLVRSLATALGGRFGIDADRLTLRLPLAQAQEVEQAAAQ